VFRGHGECSVEAYSENLGTGGVEKKDHGIHRRHGRERKELSETWLSKAPNEKILVVMFKSDIIAFEL